MLGRNERGAMCDFYLLATMVVSIGWLQLLLRIIPGGSSFNQLVFVPVASLLASLALFTSLRTTGKPLRALPARWREQTSGRAEG